jgi:hypothetical protein
MDPQPRCRLAGMTEGFEDLGKPALLDYLVQLWSVPIAVYLSYAEPRVAGNLGKAFDEACPFFKITVLLFPTLPRESSPPPHRHRSRQVPHDSGTSHALSRVPLLFVSARAGSLVGAVPKAPRPWLGGLMLPFFPPYALLC